MSTIHRGFLYITRKRGRSILLLIIILITAVFAILGLSIKSSADKEASAMRMSLSASFNIKAYPEAEQEIRDKNNGFLPRDQMPKDISTELLNKIKEMPHISDWYTCQQGWSVWTDLQLYPGSWTDFYQKASINPGIIKSPGFTLDLLKAWTQIVALYGCSNSRYHEYFRNGALTLSQGRHIREDDVNKALISTELAQKNHLSVGDKFTTEVREEVYKTGGDIDKVCGDPIALEIVGIYDVNFKQEPSTAIGADGETYIMTLEQGLVENMVLCDISTAEQVYEAIGDGIGQGGKKLYNDNATIFVDDLKNLDAAIAEVKSLGEIDQKYFDIKKDDSAYRASAKPLTQLSTVSTILIVTVIIGCVVLLCLILNMWTKGRKHEMGVLLSMGMSKHNIVLQMLFESVTLAAIALLIAIALSGCLKNSVGTLAEKLVSPSEAQKTYLVTQDSALRPVVDQVTADPIHLKYDLTAANILIAAAAVLVSTAGSVLVTSRNVLKMKPKDVLSSI